MLQFVEGGIERPLLKIQDALRTLFDALRDEVAVFRLLFQRLQNQRWQRSSKVHSIYAKDSYA